jgi:hypothetical protein
VALLAAAQAGVLLLLHVAVPESVLNAGQILVQRYLFILVYRWGVNMPGWVVLVRVQGVHAVHSHVRGLVTQTN